MSTKTNREAKSIRMKESIYHQARVAAVKARKSLAQWIEEAILAKIRRESVEQSTKPDGRS